MIQRRTQTPAYWGEGFVVDEADLDYISNLFLENETPLSLEELAVTVIQRRLRQEDVLLQRMLAKGTVYQPKLRFEVGQEVVFPGLGFALGVVAEVRPGNNPEFGAFSVMAVDFDGGRRRREFATEFAGAHKLNEDASAQPEGAPVEAAPLSEEALTATYGRSVAEKVEARLSAQPDFVRLAGKWFLRSLLADVNPGHLNIAEAILDMNSGGPLPTEALLRDLELPVEVNRTLQIFSLNYALQRDERFDEVGPAGEVLWFLRRLEPSETLDPPPALQVTPESYDSTRLNSDDYALMREIEDEWEVYPEGMAPALGKVEQGVSVTLAFPHRRYGALPLTARLAQIFPTARIAPRVRLTLIDAQSGERWPAWVVRKHRYVYGLAEMYRKYEIPAGAVLTVRPGTEPGTVLLDHGARRPKREWVRVAHLNGTQIVFEMQKRLIAVAYDEQGIVWVDDPLTFDAPRQRTDDARKSLARVVAELFPELAKLNAQSTVHARTLYNAVNLVRRTPAGPLLALMHSEPAYATVGGHYWRFDEHHLQGG